MSDLMKKEQWETGHVNVCWWCCRCNDNIVRGGGGSMEEMVACSCLHFLITV